MASINSVVLIGYVGRNPELRVASNGQSLAIVFVATNEKYKNTTTGEIKEVAEWHRVICWGRLAEIAKQYLKVGALIGIEGRVKTSQYQKDGLSTYSTDVIAHSIQFLDKKTIDSDGDSVSQVVMNAEEVESIDEDYGNHQHGKICKDCGALIPHERVKALPLALRCVECQSEYEKTHDSRVKAKEGFGGSRDDIKKMKASHWGEMVNRGRK